MPKIRLLVFFFVAFFFRTASAEARQLPELGNDPAVTIGSLPNGIRYYLVTNKTAKGRADYALVRKGFLDIGASRAAVAKLPSYPDINPCQLLADRGVGYSPDGCISYRDAGSVIHFRDIPIFDEASADSTLLVIFDLIRTADCPQTIIVSGDIDKKMLADRMHVLSMTIPVLPSESRAVDSPEWKPDSDIRFEVKPLGRNGLAGINMTVEAPRTPEEMMKTAVPLVTGRYSELLKNIITERIVKAFRGNNIPIGSLRLVHEGSPVRAGNELYTISAVTEERLASDAAGILSGIVDDLICKGADIGEFSAASTRLASDAAGRKTAISNSEYVEKCVCADLYGASLAPTSVTDRYFAASPLPPEKELPLFNNFVCALLDPENRKERITDSTAVFAPKADTVSFAGITGNGRIKMKSSVPEPLSGGELWTFSNGMKVIFKKENTPGRFAYGLMIRGGAPVRPEILYSFDIAGMSGMDFRKILSDYGIRMDCSISESDLRLSGTAPSNRLDLLLGAIASLSNELKFNPEEFEYLSSCSAIRSEILGFNALEMLEDMMSPGYEYAPTQLKDNTKGSMARRSREYFSSQFSKLNDGVFVIIGDFDSAVLQKTLSRRLSAFKCGRASTIRPKIQHNIRQGWYTRMRSGENCAAMSVSIINPFSIDGYLAFKLASTALRREIIRELAAQGMYAEFSDEVEFFPSETYTVKVICRPCAIDGLPATISGTNATSAMNALRKAINGLSSTSISERILTACKAELKSEIASICSSPSFIADAVMTRYSAGRDILSSWESSIDRVSAADVSDILHKMENGARMEIISR